MFKHAFKTSAALSGLLVLSGFGALSALDVPSASASEPAPVAAMSHDDDFDDEACGFTGTWKASDHGGNVVLEQSGDKVTGYRRAPNQEFFGKVNKTGDVFSGKYYQESPAKSGPVKARMDTCDKVTTKALVDGKWNYAEMYRVG